MLLVPGSRLGVYEIVSPLGVGGMGEVYRARDTKLNRDVALKILSPEFGHDPDRVALAGSENTASDADRFDAARIILHTLKTGQRETIIEPAADGRYVPTGHILYALGGTVIEAWAGCLQVPASVA